MRQIISTTIIFGLAPLLHAATVGVESANVDLADNELLGFTAGGITYSQSDLIQPTLTAFAGGGEFGAVNISVSETGAYFNDVSIGTSDADNSCP